MTDATDPQVLLTGLRTAVSNPDEESTIERLLAQLLATAKNQNLTDTTYRILDSPVGKLLVAGTEVGIVRVAFSCQDHDQALEELSDQIGPRILRSANNFELAARQLDEYFAGTRTRFSLPIDLRLAHGFRRTVLNALREIDYGHTRTYTQVAAAAGSVKAVRAVGTACAKNPLPIIVPCHRVRRSDGSPGGYAGGTEAKRLLLALEGSL